LNGGCDVAVPAAGDCSGRSCDSAAADTCRDVGAAEEMEYVVVAAAVVVAEMNVNLWKILVVAAAPHTLLPPDGVVVVVHSNHLVKQETWE